MFFISESDSIHTEHAENRIMYGTNSAFIIQFPTKIDNGIFEKICLLAFIVFVQGEQDWLLILPVESAAQSSVHSAKTVCHLQIDFVESFL